MNDNSKRNLLVVFKDGPNHGFILEGHEALPFLVQGDFDTLRKTGLDAESIPKIGSGMRMPAYWYLKATTEQIPRERAHAIWAKIGVPESRLYTYRVVSIEDDVLVYQYEHEA